MAEKIAKKFNGSYEKFITVIRCKSSFIILRSALLCIRGSRYWWIIKGSLLLQGLTPSLWVGVPKLLLE